MHPNTLRPAALPMAGGLVAAVFTAFCGPAVHADALSAKSDRFVAQMAATQGQNWSSVIVTLAGPLTPAQEKQLSALNGDVYRHLPALPYAALRLPSRNLSRLASLPFIERLSADVSVRKNDEFTVAASGADVANDQYSLSGKGITVAVIDSGVNQCEDLKGTAQVLDANGNLKNVNISRVLAGATFVPPADPNHPEKPDDTCGHGTHVAGILAGNGKSSSGDKYFHTYYGIARQAGIVNARVLDGNGQGSVSSVLAGIDWVLRNKDTYNIRVMNLSLGHPVTESYTTDPLCQAVEAAWKSGITVVCAAGNNGRLSTRKSSLYNNEQWGTNYGSIQSPGNDPYVITVGAMKAKGAHREDSLIATYSSRGPTRLDFVMKPDIVAPGNKVISLEAKNGFLTTAYGTKNLIKIRSYSYTDSTNLSDKYFLLSGTSMAAPVVSGAVALLLQKDPTLTPDTIKARLMLSADKWGFAITDPVTKKVTDPHGSADPLTFGAGYLNIAAALNATTSIPRSRYALSPTVAQDDQGNVYVTGDKAIWGSGDPAGTKAIWGSEITDLRAIWGTKAIWGSSTNLLSNSRAIWGTQVWSDRAIWGTATDGVDLSSNAIDGEN